ncbi:leucine-rich repeat extensin-like protein 5 [Penaeus japonicus]|uniref:leucine-rich repeat extensin-like protein 5 n=1 Tax=Penaeus japonicus TaxID=27405 RepID=UPI001C70FBC2|nr:leucine-rich repeat extensin-like protein 5 [Penaeus japonicus]
MGYQQTSPPASPSSGRNKGRRPTSLAVGASPPAAPSKASPTGGARAPPSPTPSKASPSRSSPPKRTGSIGKGSASPARPTTKTQGPNLATEARSKVRPCGCSRRHGGGGHHGGHQGGHHHASPEPPKERVRKQPKAPSSPPAKPRVEPAPEVNHQQEVPLPPLPEVAGSDDAKGANRYISTLVWVPRMHPEKFSTTLIVSPEEATFTDAIYIKPRYQELLHEEHLYEQGKNVTSYSSQFTGSHTASSVHFTPMAVS